MRGFVAVTVLMFLLDFTTGDAVVCVEKGKNSTIPFNISTVVCVEKARNGTIPLNISDLKDVQKVTLEKCENGNPVSIYCSPNEKRNGCPNHTPSPVSLQNGSLTLTVTISDAGCNLLQVTDNENVVKEMEFIVVTPQRSTVTPQRSTVTPQRSTETPNRSTEAQNLTSTESPNTSSINIPLAIGIPIPAVVVVLAISSFFVYKHIKKNKIYCRREPEPRIYIPVRSPESDETPVDSVTIDNENHQKNQSLMLHTLDASPHTTSHLLNPSPPLGHT